MIDFFNARPATVIKAKDKLATPDSSLFDFEVVDIVERRLQESPMAASKLNDRMALAIGLFLFLVPIPYGANWPLAWLGAMAIVGALTAYYFTMLSILDPNRPAQYRNYLIVIVPGLLAILWALVQMIPLGLPGVLGLAADVAPESISFSASATMLGVPRMVSYLLLFILISEVCTNRFRTERLLRWIFYGIVVHAVWALLSLSVFADTLLLLEKTDYKGLATGTFINRNSFATFMGMGVVVGCALVVFEMRSPAHRSPNRKSKLKGLTTEAAYTSVLIFIVLAALFASASRLGVLATAVGTWFTVVSLLMRTGVSKLSIFLGSVLVVALGFTAPLALFGQELLQRLVYLFVDSSTRLELYSQTFAMIGERWAVGFGLDSFGTAFELFHTPELSTSEIWDKPHSSYLTLWSELGIFAGSLPMLAVLVAFVMAVRSIGNRERSFFPAAAAAGVMILGAIHSLGDFSLEIAANTYVFVAITALGLARRSRAREV